MLRLILYKMLVSVVSALTERGHAAMMVGEISRSMILCLSNNTKTHTKTHCTMEEGDGTEEWYRKGDGPQSVLMCVSVICHRGVTTWVWRGGGWLSTQRLASHKMWFRKTATWQVHPTPPTYPPRAINYHCTPSKLLRARADTSKWCIGQEAMKIYGFLITTKGAEGTDPAQRLSP